MTSPTDLAERLRRNIAPIVGPWRRDEWDTLEEAADLLDRLSALESAASGAVTDAEIAEVIRFLRIARVCEHPGCHEECGGLQPPIMAVAADLLERLGPRLAKAEHRVTELEAQNSMTRTPPSTDARAALVKKCQSLCVSITDVNAGRSRHCWACQAATLLVADGDTIKKLQAEIETLKDMANLR